MSASPCTPKSEKSDEPVVPDWTEEDVDRVFGPEENDEGTSRETAKQVQDAKDLAAEVRSKVIRFREATVVADHIAAANWRSHISSGVVVSPKGVRRPHGHEACTCACDHWEGLPDFDRDVSSRQAFSLLRNQWHADQ